MGPDMDPTAADDVACFAESMARIGAVTQSTLHDDAAHGTTTPLVPMAAARLALPQAHRPLLSASAPQPCLREAQA